MIGRKSMHKQHDINGQVKTKIKVINAWIGQSRRQ